jgi:uncharacterized membrane protein YqjE
MGDVWTEVARLLRLSFLPGWALVVVQVLTYALIAAIAWMAWTTHKGADRS